MTYPVNEQAQMDQNQVKTEERKMEPYINGRQTQTSGGRHSSACRRSTENPPWVLVSEAVRVLQKECTWNRGGSGMGGSLSTMFSSC